MTYRHSPHTAARAMAQMLKAGTWRGNRAFDDHLEQNDKHNEATAWELCHMAQSDPQLHETLTRHGFTVILSAKERNPQLCLF